MRLSVQVPTYNRPQALRAVLDAYARQSDLDFEMVIADDGSGPETRETIHRFQETAPFPVQHVWQEDRGFRLAGIRNRAIAATRAEYLVLTDGDCLPLRHHVARHRALAEPGWFVSGSRVYLDQALTDEVEAGAPGPDEWGWGDWLRRRVGGAVNRVSPLLSLPPSAAWRRWQPDRWQGVTTANLAVWRADLVAVNGFDEGFEGWGFEDTDLAIRLTRAGVRQKTGRYAVPVLHLWHQTASRAAVESNQTLLAELQTSDRIRARQGLAEAPVR